MPANTAKLGYFDKCIIWLKTIKLTWKLKIGQAHIEQSIRETKREDQAKNINELDE